MFLKQFMMFLTDLLVILLGATVFTGSALLAIQSFGKGRMFGLIAGAVVSLIFMCLLFFLCYGRKAKQPQ